MVHLTQDITIRSDPATIFAWLTDLSRGGAQVFDFGLEIDQLAWHEGKGLTRSTTKSRNTITASGPVALGTTVTSRVESCPPDTSPSTIARVATRPRETVMQITSFDPPHRLGFHILHGPYPSEASLVLTPVAGGTQLTYAITTLQANLRTTLLLAVLSAPMRGKILQKLKNIAEAIEADAPSLADEQET